MNKFIKNDYLIDQYTLDFFSILLISISSYLVFVIHNEIIFELINVYYVSILIVFSIFFSSILKFFNSSLLRIIFFVSLITITIDIQFSFINDWGGKLISIPLGLLSIFWLIRKNISLVMVSVFGLVNLGTIVFPLIEYSLQSHGSGSGLSERKSNLPVYVHIVLDEHMGAAGFDETIKSHGKIKRDIENFFKTNKFRLFKNSYSNYYDSADSIYSLLNFSKTINRGKTYKINESGKTKFSLIKNKYFDYLISKGYSLNVYQSTFMGFCDVLVDKINKCITYNHSGISGKSLIGVRESEKFEISLSLYSARSFFKKESKKLYRYLNYNLTGLGIGLPDWPDWSGRLGPIPVLPVFDALIEDVSSAPPGTAFFAHLLIPHHPYSVDAKCRIRRPVLAWKHRYRGTYLLDPGNSPSSRLARYEEYFAQIQCALSKLEKLVDGLKARGTFKDSVIIVHGDHGSRIALVEARYRNKDRLSRRDFHDAFSTLFAVKSPEIAPGQDSRMRALPDLLRDTVFGGLDGPPNPESDERPSVFLEDQRQSKFFEFPMPEFPRQSAN